MTIIVALLVFGFIVLVHEFGHFIVAKHHGVRVHEFAIGMGPKLFSIKRETEYSIRVLPFGGFIRMEGEDEESSDPKSFNKKSIGQRASIIFAGPFMNLILAILVFIPIFIYVGSPSTTIAKVENGSPAQQAGILVGDTITEINGKEIKNWNQITSTIDASKGKTLDIKVERNDDVENIKVTPKNEKGDFKLGIGTKLEKNIGGAFVNSIKTTINILGQMITLLVQLVTGNLPSGAAESISGPVGIISVVGDATRSGFMDVLSLTALISLNLALMNLLPIPALDGGRLLFLAVEAIRGGKKLNQEREGMINFLGFAALMALMLFVTYRDMIKLFNK
jgi:regulator of sigma E protease